MYYDSKNGRAISAAEIAMRGMDADRKDLLAAFGIYPLEIEKPEYDAATQGIEPDGKAEPKQDDENVYVQRMRVFDMLARHRDWKKEEATTRRWEHETGGLILPDGTRILTGIDDQNRIATALQGMRDNGISEVDFKAASGWMRLTLEELAAVAGAVAGHVQKCFSNERALHEAIDQAASLGELNAINPEDGWPLYSMPEEADEQKPEPELAE